MPREKSLFAELPGTEQLRERALKYKRLAIAVVNESFALKLRALSEEFEDKTGRLNERQNR